MKQMKTRERKKELGDENNDRSKREGKGHRRKINSKEQINVQRDRIERERGKGGHEEKK
jgi:hypothetical protein